MNIEEIRNIKKDYYLNKWVLNGDKTNSNIRIVFEFIEQQESLITNLNSKIVLLKANVKLLEELENKQQKEIESIKEKLK